MRSDWGESLGYRLMGCWSPFAAAITSASWSGVAVASETVGVDIGVVQFSLTGRFGGAGKVLLLDWFLRLIALVQLQPGERARFPCGEILADTADGLSVPVVRSGNTGKSRFLEASLAPAVPIPLQDSGRTVLTGGDLFQSRSNRSQGSRRGLLTGERGGR